MSHVERYRPGVAPSVARLLDTAVLVRTEPPDLTFMARELVQCTLPHADPGQVPFWRRTNGHYTLAIASAFDPASGQLVGYPFGSIPRLLLFWMTSEAVRTGSRRLELGRTYNAFLRRLGYSPATGGGVRSDAARVREQSRRLFTATISFIYADAAYEARLSMPVTSKMVLWWSPKAPDAPWDGWIELSEEFHKAVVSRPVPLDLRALYALKRSPLALDLYAWSTHKAHAVAQRGRPQFVPWRGLMAQVGADYADVQNFRRSAERALRRVQAVYPGLVLEEAVGGVVVMPSSRPAIAT